MAKLPPLSVPSSSQPLSKLVILRNAAITLVSLALAALWIALGPHGDFLNGRAFTISTLDQVTYVYYNWSFSLPLDPTAQYRFQAWNNRLAGKTSFVPSDPGHGLIDPNKNKITVSIETTAPPDRYFSINPWTGQGTFGFSALVHRDLPNTYGIDYANIIVHLPCRVRYNALIWTTTPQRNTSSDVLPAYKWSVHMDDLEACGIHFQSVQILTDSGDIDVDGLLADAGNFQTMGGKINGNFTIPPKNLTSNTSWSGNYTLNYLV